MSTLSADALTVGTLRMQYLPEPIGIDVKMPAFSWQLVSDKRATMQQSYQVEVRSLSGATMLSETPAEGTGASCVTF